MSRSRSERREHVDWEVMGDFRGENGRGIRRTARFCSCTLLRSVVCWNSPFGYIFTELGQGMRLWLTPLLLLTVCVVFFYEMVGMENGSEL